MFGYLFFLGMAPKAKPAPAASADDTAADSNGSDTPSVDSACDNIRMLMEQLQLLHARMDDQARTHSELLRRDALRDHPVAINTAATPPVDASFKLASEFVLAPQHEQTRRGDTNRRHTIDLDFVAMTADWATNIDGDSFSRSFRMDAPLMPKTGELKVWKRDFVSFLSIKAAALIPPVHRLALSSSGGPLSPVAQRYAHAMLVQCCRQNKHDAQTIAGVRAGRPDCGTAAWEMLCERLDAQSISRTLSLLDRMIVRQACGQSVSAYVHAVKQHFDDLNECMKRKDGSAAIHPHVLAMVMIRGLSNVGQYGQAKVCVINAFDTDFIMSADRVMGSIIHKAQNLNADDTFTSDSAAYGHLVNAFLANRKRQGVRRLGG
jgi:hypothetical protein